MKTILVALALLVTIQSYSQDLNWNTSAIPDGSTSFNFGSIGSPASNVTFAVTGPGTITSGPARFTTIQGDITFRTAITFAAGEVKTYTLTFSPAVCNLTFNIYDIDGDNTSGGDQAIVTADNSGSPQNITLTALDATPPTISGSGTATATITGTQGNQTDDRVRVSISGCITTLTIQYGNNPAGPAGGRSFSIGNLNWTPASTDLDWNTSLIPDGSTSFDFGCIGTPASNVIYAVTGPGTITSGPARFTTAQGDITFRTAINFAAGEIKTYTFTFSPGVCGLTFILYDIDGDNTSGGDQAVVTANNSGSPQNITMTALDPGFAGGPPTITGSGTATATVTGTQGNQTDDRVQITITGCVTTLTIQYSNNPAGPAGGRSFSIGNLEWTAIPAATADLDWNTVCYIPGALTKNFGSIGTPLSDVSLNITGSTAQMDAGFPVKYAAITPGNICPVPCALRSRVNFTSLAEVVSYTFTFNPGVCGLSFNINDIDGDNTSGDQAIVTANYLGSPQNITMTALDPGFAGGPPTITGSGTATATATGTQGNQDDDRVGISIPGCVTTLTIQYRNNPNNATAGQRSFSIGNLNWSTSTLPVSFTHFSGQKIANGAVQLKWSTESEMNAGKYEIERSTDGQNFITAGFVTALNRAGNYSFTDYTPTQGTLFYRIKEIDIDGQFKYSTTIALKFNNGSKPGITLFPNPASSSLFITTNNNALIERIQIFDYNGKIVYQKQGAENKIDISTLAKGLYLVKVTDNTGEIATGRFMKQ